MMKKLTIFFALMGTLNAFGSTGSKKCDSLKIHYFNNTNKLAELMGKHKIFDMKVLNTYRDNQKIERGSIVVITSKTYKPEVVFGVRTKRAWSYEYSKDQLKVKISARSKKIRRNVASLDFCLRSI